MTWQAGWLAPCALLLAACGSTPTRSLAPLPQAAPPAWRTPVVARPAGIAEEVVRAAPNPCAPTREHRDSDYTRGGLYLPGVSDGGPAQAIDVSGVREPLPRVEPRARQGNRSPYSVLGKSYRVLDSAEGYREKGVASWYGTKFNGRATSSGELYDICQFTAAHKTLPLPSFVRVTNLDNGRSLVVRVNDRGPFHAGRVMDLSYAAAVRLGVDRTGTARVELQAIDPQGRAAPMAQRESSRPDAQTAEPVAVSAGAIADNDAGRAERVARVVQVGSFGERSNALRLADRLQGAGVQDIDIDRAEVSGEDVWRVRIGPVATEKLAGLLDQLRALDLPNPRVLSQ